MMEAPTMGIDMIRKRDGREVPFDQDKIEQAIFASFQASGSARGHETSRKLTEEVVRLLENNENISAIPSVEQVQDTVEQVLMRNGFTRTAKSYILYRAERSRVREMNSRLMRTFGDIVFKDASDALPTILRCLEADKKKAKKVKEVVSNGQIKSGYYQLPQLKEDVNRFILFKTGKKDSATLIYIEGELDADDLITMLFMKKE